MHDIPTNFLATPDAWRGPDLQARRDWIYVLSPAEVTELKAALQVGLASGKPMNAWTQEDFPLPVLAGTVRAWMEELNIGRGFVLVRGFPVQDHSKEECERIYWGMGLYMGAAVSQNSDGDLLGHVRDTGVAPEKGVRLYKTRVEQDFHVDGADIIGLFCLRAGKSGGVSRIVSSVAVFNEIMRTRPDLIPTLFETFPFDNHGQEAPGAPPWFDFPVCHMADGRLRTFFVPWYIRDSQRFEAAPRLSDKQVACVEAIETIANDPAFYLDMDFEPGDMQLLKNASIMHKRTAYEDWDAPDQKRHLLRLWLTARDFSAGDARLRQGVAARSGSSGTCEREG